MMLKRCAIVVVLSLGIIATGNPQNSRDGHKDAAQNKSSPTVTIVDNSTRQQEANSTTQKPPETHAQIEWSNWALVLIGALGVLAAVATLKKIEHQTKATEIAAVATQASAKAAEDAAVAAKDNAKAALLNAQVLRNAERPWILIFSEKMPDCEASALFAKNCGRTPARLVLSSKNNWLLIKPSERLDFEPQRPNYGSISPLYEPIIILPNESTYILNITEFDVIRECESAERFEAVKAGTLDLYIFGKLAYQDLLHADSESFHETAWCCHYLTLPDVGNKLSMFGLPGYTYHT